MPVVPEKRLERVQFYENHIAPFTTNAVAIGITSIEATDLQTKTEAARSAYNDQQAALQASKVATESFYNAVTTMNTAGNALIKKIRRQGRDQRGPECLHAGGDPCTAGADAGWAAGTAPGFHG